MQNVKISLIDQVWMRVETDPSTTLQLWSKYRTLAKDFQFMPKYKAGMWDGYLQFFDRINLRIPIGLYRNLAKYCQSSEIELDDSEIPTWLRGCNEKKDYQTVEKMFASLHPCRELKEGGFEEITQHDYQITGLMESINQKRVTFRAATSAGKSLLIYGIVRYFLAVEKKPILIIVPTIGLTSQMVDDFVVYSHKNGWNANGKCFSMNGQQKGNSNDFECVVSTWQSLLKKTPEFFDRFGCVIVDEQHTAKSESIQKILKQTKNAEYRIGMSGTIPTHLAESMTIESYVGPITHLISAPELMESGRAQDIEIICCQLGYSTEIRKLYNLTPAQRKEIPDGKQGRGQKIYGMEYDGIVVENPQRNLFITRLSKQVQGDCLIMVDSIDHANALYQQISDACSDKEVHLYIGEVKAKVRNAIRKTLNSVSDTDHIIIATPKTMQVGISIPSLKHLILASPTKAPTTLFQSIGRMMRLTGGKLSQRVYDLADDLRIGQRNNYCYDHFLDRIQLYAKEGYKYTFKSYNI